MAVSKRAWVAEGSCHLSRLDQAVDKILAPLSTRSEARYICSNRISNSIKSNILFVDIQAQLWAQSRRKQKR